MFYKGKGNFKFYSNKIRTIFEPVTSQILEATKQLNIRPDSEIISTMSMIEKGFKKHGKSNFFLLLANPEIFEQTDKLWRY